MKGDFRALPGQGSRSLKQAIEGRGVSCWAPGVLNKSGSRHTHLNELIQRAELSLKCRLLNLRQLDGTEGFGGQMAWRACTIFLGWWSPRFQGLLYGVVGLWCTPSWEYATKDEGTAGQTLCIQPLLLFFVSPWNERHMNWTKGHEEGEVIHEDTNFPCG